jgi:hypothetical protein
VFHSLTPQPHLRKCFDALFKLEFGKEAGSVDIHAMVSPDSETVQFAKTLKVRCRLWL